MKDDPRASVGTASKAVVADRFEVARSFVGQHQRHPLDHQRLDDPRHQPLTEPDHVEIAVQVAGERNQRTAIVVAIAIEHPIQRVLNRLADRLRQQHDDRRRENRDEPVLLVCAARERERHQLENRHAERQRGRDKRGIGDGALDDDLDVTQPVPDDRRREGERDKAQRNRRQLQRERGIDAKRPRQRVPEGKRTDAQGGAPRDPAKLPARRDRGQLLEAAHQDDERGRRAEEQVHRLQPIKRLDDRGEQWTVGRAANQRHDAGAAENERRQVDGQDQRRRRSPRGTGALREHQREVQQQRRQQRLRDGVTPVEHPVEPIERAVE